MKFGKFIAITILILLPTSTKASITNGTIESGNKNALVCHSVDCTTPTPGVINFAPSGTTPITISDTNGIDGVAWGNEIGWINFDPTGDEGLTINPSTGIISGKAWSQVSGWINFSVTGQSVKINNDGEFEGYAWTGGPYGGWIRFDCDFVGACVKTDWRPIPARPVPGSPIGGSTAQKDIPNLITDDFCLNIQGYQDRVPDGYAKDQGGLCLLNIDYCKNIEGVQLTIPNQYVLNGAGQCILLNDKNKDEFISGKSEIVSGTLDKNIVDYCSNLFGLQVKLPDGFTQENFQCFPSEMDYCPNILGNQYSVPEDMKINNNGECIKMTKGEIDINNIFKNQKEQYDKNKKIKVIKYGFVPKSLQILIPLSKNYQLDLISSVFSLNLIGLLILFIKKIIKLV